MYHIVKNKFKVSEIGKLFQFILYAFIHKELKITMLYKNIKTCNPEIPFQDKMYYYY